MKTHCQNALTVTASTPHLAQAAAVFPVGRVASLFAGGPRAALRPGLRCAAAVLPWILMGAVHMQAHAQGAAHRSKAAPARAVALQGAGASASAASSRITQVKVYPGVASVERVARLAAGARSFTFACLPAGLDVQSLQVAADKGVAIGEISTRIDTREMAAVCASPLDASIRTLEDQMAAVQAEADALQNVQSYLKTIAGGGAPAPAAGSSAASVRIQTGSPASGAQVSSTAQALHRTGADAALRLQPLKRQQEALERQLKPLLAERERTGGEQARVMAVTVNLATVHDTDLHLIYQVRGPGWQPSYRASLNPATGAVLLERQALVAQNTGEDWSQVALTLSTGQPGRATTGPVPRPWTVDIAPPPVAPKPYADEGVMAQRRMTAPVAAAPAALSKAAAPMPSFDVSVFDKGFATEFSVPQRVSVPTSGERVTLALGSHNATAKVLTRVTPALDTTAWLVAEIAPPPGVWPAGPVSLYRDGAFVGNGRFDPSTPAANGLSFGPDEQVVVRAEPPQQTSGTAGLTGSRIERRTVHAYAVENRHRNTVQLQVLDAAPVSRNEAIEVSSQYQPQPTERNWNRQPGTVLWAQPLAAGETARFSAEHTVRYPKDVRLQEQD